MKQLVHYGNAVLILLTIGAVILLGEDAIGFYMLLAAFQLFIGFIYIFYTLFYTPEYVPKIFLYWFAVIAYITLVNYFHPHTFIFLTLPLCIASYHCYLTYLISDQPSVLTNWFQRKFAHS